MLAALAASVVVTPLVSSDGSASLVFDLAFSGVLLLSLGAFEAGRSRAWAAALALVAILLRWWAFVTRDEILLLAASLSAALLLGFVVYSLLLFLFRTTEVGPDTLYGGIAVYVILGLLWSTWFAALELIAPGSFLQDEEPLHLVESSRGLASLLYYSFVTLTTLGYGDVVPTTPAGRFLSAIEAVCGQLYLAVFVARLVGLHISGFRA